MNRISIGCIVEGKGEEKSVPVLLRKIATQVMPGLFVDVPRPFIVKRNQMSPSGDQIHKAIEGLFPHFRVFIIERRGEKRNGG